MKMRPLTRAMEVKISEETRSCTQACGSMESRQVKLTRGPKVQDAHYCRTMQRNEQRAHAMRMRKRMEATRARSAGCLAKTQAEQVEALSWLLPLRSDSWPRYAPYCCIGSRWDPCRQWGIHARYARTGCSCSIFGHVDRHHVRVHEGRRVLRLRR